MEDKTMGLKAVYRAASNTTCNALGIINDLSDSGRILAKDLRLDTLAESLVKQEKREAKGITRDKLEAHAIWLLSNGDDE